MTHTMNHRTWKPTHTTYPATIMNKNLNLNPLPPPPPLKSMIVSKTYHTHTQKTHCEQIQTHYEQNPNPWRQTHGERTHGEHTPILFYHPNTTQSPPKCWPKHYPIATPKADPNSTQIRPKRRPNFYYTEQTRIYKEGKKNYLIWRCRKWEGLREKREGRSEKESAENEEERERERERERIRIKYTFFLSFFTYDEQWGCICTTSLFMDVKNFCIYTFRWSVFLRDWWLK